MRKTTPFLWFENQAEQAAVFYTSTFDRSRIVDVIYYPGSTSGSRRRVMSVTFELDGQTFIALNGGPSPPWPFSPTLSCSIQCRTQQEMDALWGKLGEGGERLQRGWLRDRFGVIWQVDVSAPYPSISGQDRFQTPCDTYPFAYADCLNAGTRL